MAAGAPAPSARPQAVLFVCNQNIIRSPMAAGLLRLRWGKTIWVDSCGVRPAGPRADPFAIEVMDELGVDLTPHRAKTFDDLDDANFDLIVSLTPEAHHRALEFTRTLAAEVEYWPTYDPALGQGSREQRLEEFRAVRDALAARVLARFGRPSTGQA
ncbi:MAG: low molecular weight phosphatase family protein [Alphaproteobacteria bacterium]|nr:low molecular weight phosphatase family protein [Alphaproteobacteria bacterium]